jgi:hypothetical protein
MTTVVLSQLDEQLSQALRVLQVVDHTRQRIHDINSVGRQLLALPELLQGQALETWESFLIFGMRFEEPVS